MGNGKWENEKFIMEKLEQLEHQETLSRIIISTSLQIQTLTL